MTNRANVPTENPCAADVCWRRMFGNLFVAMIAVMIIGVAPSAAQSNPILIAIIPTMDRESLTFAESLAVRLVSKGDPSVDIIPMQHLTAFMLEDGFNPFEYRAKNGEMVAKNDRRQLAILARADMWIALVRDSSTADGMTNVQIGVTTTGKKSVALEGRSVGTYAMSDVQKSSQLIRKAIDSDTVFQALKKTRGTPSR